MAKLLLLCVVAVVALVPSQSRLSLRSAPASAGAPRVVAVIARRRCCSTWLMWSAAGCAGRHRSGTFPSPAGLEVDAAAVPPRARRSAWMVQRVRAHRSCHPAFDLHQVEVISSGPFGFAPAPQSLAALPPPPFELFCRSTAPLFLRLCRLYSHDRPLLLVCRCIVPKSQLSDRLVIVKLWNMTVLPGSVAAVSLADSPGESPSVISSSVGA